MARGVLGIQSAGEWLGEQFAEHASVPVRYSRSSAATVLAAHPGRTRLEVDGQPVRLASQFRDFCLDADALVLPGLGQTLPAEGDRIEETGDDGTVHVYEVMPPMADEDCYDFTAGDRRRLRIHTREVDEQ